MRPCTVFRVQLGSHIDVRVCFQVHFGKVAIVTEFYAAVLQVVVCEEAGVDMLTQELSELKDELVLKHLKNGDILIRISETS